MIMSYVTRNDLKKWCSIPLQKLVDEAHEMLFEKQSPFFREVKIEFYKNLDFQN